MRNESWVCLFIASVRNVLLYFHDLWSRLPENRGIEQFPPRIRYACFAQTTFRIIPWLDRDGIRLNGFRSGLFLTSNRRDSHKAPISLPALPHSVPNLAETCPKPRQSLFALSVDPVKNHIAIWPNITVT